jgi:hypothetical protein
MVPSFFFSVLIHHLNQLLGLVCWDSTVMVLEVQTNRFASPRESSMSALPTFPNEPKPYRHLTGIVKPNIFRVVADCGQKLLATSRAIR